MKKRYQLTSVCAAFSILLLGCPGGDDATSDTNNDSSESSNSSPTTSATTVTASTTDTTTADTTADTSADTTATTVDTTAAESSSSTEDPSIFHFNETPPEDYVRVDRKGFPAVNTGLQIHEDKDAYNAGTNENDVNGDFFEGIGTSLELLHWGGPDLPAAPGPGLDDDLATFDLVPCIPPESSALGDPGNCILQGGPAVVPDVLKIDLDLPPGFHIDAVSCGPVANGRGLADPVIDIILAVLLLDLSQPLPDGWGGIPCPDAGSPGAPATAFLSIALIGGASLNPSANDVPLNDAFPFLADAQ